MKKITAILSAIPVLAIGALASLGATWAYIVPVAEFIAEKSASVTTNFYLLGGFMVLVTITSLFQGLLIIRIVWGPQAIRGADKPNRPEKDEDDEADDLARVKGMRVTGTKKALIFFVCIAVNTAVFDHVGRGVVVGDTRAYRVITLLRSPKGADRMSAVGDAVLLTGDKRIAQALKTVLDHRGEAREWAAYAAGARKDFEAESSLLNLARTGSARERAAAVIALARLKSTQLIEIGPEILDHLGEHRGDLFAALGMVGKLENMSEEQLNQAGRFLAEQLLSDKLDKELRRVVIWALGQLNAPAGLAPIERLLEQPGDSATLCIGLEALGKIGAQSTSPKLIATIYTIDRDVKCPEVVYADLTGHEILLSSSINIVERLLYEIAHIGDREARPDMEKLARDQTFSATVRRLAAEIAFQMKYKPLPQ